MNKKIIAKKDRNQMMTSDGMAIYFPSTPEVLIRNVAMIKPDKFLI